MATSINSLPNRVFAPLTPALCAFVPHDRVAALAEASDQPLDFVHAQLSDSEFVRACECGELSLATMLSEVRTRLDADLTEAHLQGLWALAYEPDLGAIEALCQRFGTALSVLIAEAPLLKAGLDAYLPEVSRAGANNSLGFGRAIVCTCDFGFTASDPALYEAIVEACGGRAEAFALVDGNRRATEAALAAGWRIVSD